MSRLRIQPVVEGHGEPGAIRVLLEKIAEAAGRGTWASVLTPIRQSRGRLARQADFARTIELAAMRSLAGPAGETPWILVVLDGDDEPGCVLGPRLRTWAAEARGDVDTSVVVAVREFETWFVASADTMADVLDMAGETVPDEPERHGLRKAWIEARMRERRYSPVVDQARLASRVDVRRCRARSPSFDKLAREVEARLRRAPASG